MTTKQTILLLLQADMRNSKLLLGLEKAGLQADDFHTGLDLIVLEFLGFPQIKNRDAFYDFYYQRQESLIEGLTVSTFREQQKALAEILYQELLLYKQKLE